jgi:hypothetical protein
MEGFNNGLQFGAVDKDGVLTIRIDTRAQGAVSASGKSIVIASTNGNTAVAVGGEVFKLGLNFYKSNPKAPAVAVAVKK